LGKAGELAQLARALAWHARGRRFDSDILHRAGPYVRLFYFHPLPVAFYRCAPICYAEKSTSFKEFDRPFLII
jgi:hypothetical protein